MARTKIQLNSATNLREVLQEAYTLSEELVKQTQDEIAKLANSTRLQDEILESRSRYADAINKLLLTKNKAIEKKIDIAKILQEVIKYNGDLNKLQEGGSQAVSFDFSKIKDIVNQKEKEKNEVQTIQLKK